MEILFVLPMGPLPIPQGIPQAALIMGLMGMGNMEKIIYLEGREIQNMAQGILVIALWVQELGLQIIGDQGRVSVQGVESLWGDCRFIPADWGHM